jgi:hypothetical protein
MTHAFCPNCWLRFVPAAAAHLAACPTCGDPPLHTTDPRRLVGFTLFRPEDEPRDLPEAIAVSLPIPGPRGGRL